MKNRLFLYLCLFILCSCSEDEPEEEITKFQLEEGILGKWELSEDLTIASFGLKQQENDCQVFALVFNSDNSYSISHSGGISTGTYEVKNETSVSLGSNGSLSDISVTGDKMDLRADLEDGCSAATSVNKSADFVAGDCISFFDCLQSPIWKSEDGNGIELLRFEPDLKGNWFEKWKLDTAVSCVVSEQKSSLEEYDLVLRNNQSNYLFISGVDANGVYVAAITIKDPQLLEAVYIYVDHPGVTRYYTPAEETAFAEYLSWDPCPQKTFVPDDAFEADLISLGYDDLMDDYVLTDNIKKVKQLFISYDLQDLTGIEDFTALTDLTVLASQSLTQVDLSGNTELKNLYLYAPIVELDLSNNPLLRIVELISTDIKVLDISQNVNLNSLLVEYGRLEELRSVKSENLERLNIGYTSLLSMNLEHFPKLKHLFLVFSQQTHIDVSMLSQLEELYLSNNFLTAINISANSQLEELYLDHNDLVKLDISNNPLLSFVRTRGNLDLQCIQIDEAQANLQIVKDEVTEVSVNCGW